MKPIEVIIVSYNGAEMITACLKSVFTSTIPVKVNVLDNDSNDNTANIIQESFPEVEFEQSEKNLGFGKGNNTILRKILKTEADYVYLCNQDALLKSDTLEHLKTQAETNKDFGILSPIHLCPVSKKLDFYFASQISEETCPGFLSDAYQNKLEGTYEIDFMHAAGWLIQTDALKKAGIFDPVFPHYGEDDDLVQRFKRFGYKIGIAASSIIYHGDAKRERKINDEYYGKFIMTLRYFKDLNKSYSKILMSYLMSRFRSLLWNLARLKFVVIKKDLALLFKVLGQQSALKKSRKASLKEGAFIHV